MSRIASWQNAVVKVGKTEYGLKRCPFCGSNQLELKEVEDSPQVGMSLPSMFYISCECGVAGPTGHGLLGKGQFNAIMSWNERK